MLGRYRHDYVGSNGTPSTSETRKVEPVSANRRAPVIAAGQRSGERKEGIDDPVIETDRPTQPALKSIERLPIGDELQPPADERSPKVWSAAP